MSESIKVVKTESEGASSEGQQLRMAVKAAGYDVKSDLLKSVKLAMQQGAVIITGKSGAGKDYVADVVLKPLQKHVVLLDSFGSQEGSKWVVNTKKLAEKLSPMEDFILVGTADNLSEVSELAKAQYDAASPLTCFMIVPVPTIYKSAVLAKANELEKKHGNEKWIRGWRECQNWTNSKLIKYLVSEIKPKFAKISADIENVFVNELTGAVPTDGWHRKGKKS